LLIVTASDWIASMLPLTLKVTVAVKRLPKACDVALWYHTLNGPSTGHLGLLVDKVINMLVENNTARNFRATSAEIRRRRLVSGRP